MSDKTVGLLSPGAMGSVVGRVLIEHGVNVLTCLEDRGPATRERAREAGRGACLAFPRRPAAGSARWRRSPAPSRISA